MKVNVFLDDEDYQDIAEFMVYTKCPESDLERVCKAYTVAKLHCSIESNDLDFIVVNKDVSKGLEKEIL